MSMDERVLKRRIEALETALENALRCPGRHDPREFGAVCDECRKTAITLLTNSTNRARIKRLHVSATGDGQ